MSVRVVWVAGTPADDLAPPPEGAAGVWLIVPTAASEAAAEALLSEAERARRDRFQHAGARMQFMTGRWLLRTVAGALTATPPAEVVLRESERGALELVTPGAIDRWHVNLSHTDGLVAVAAARQAVGVDVEDTERRGRTVELADRFFAPSEAAALRALPESEQRRRFFDLWTLKEAYIKARGMGLAIPLASFAFDLKGPAIAFSVDATAPANAGERASRWAFARFDATPRHRLAVALERLVPEL